MKKETKIALGSAAGLGIALFIAWYFSRGKSSAQSASATAQPSTANGYTINVPPLDIPPITSPTLPPASAASCCTRCSSASDISGGKILQSGNVIDQIFSATHQAIQSAVSSPQTNAVSSVQSPLGDKLIGAAYGIAQPSYAWWTNDANYRAAYIEAYNYTVGYANTQISDAKRRNQVTAGHILGQFANWPLMQTLPGSFVTRSYDAVIAWINAQADLQNPDKNRSVGTAPVTSDPLAPFGFFPLTLQALNKYLQLYGDTNTGNTTIGVPDQPVYTIQ